MNRDTIKDIPKEVLKDIKNTYKKELKFLNNEIRKNKPKNLFPNHKYFKGGMKIEKLIFSIINIGLDKTFKKSNKIDREIIPELNKQLNKLIFSKEEFSFFDIRTNIKLSKSIFKQKKGRKKAADIMLEDEIVEIKNSENCDKNKGLYEVFYLYQAIQYIMIRKINNQPIKEDSFYIWNPRYNSIHRFYLDKLKLDKWIILYKIKNIKDYLLGGE